MARQVAADEAQQKRKAVNEAQEASHLAEELSKQGADHLAQIATLEKRLERVKRKAAEEMTKARDQGIRDFLDGNAGDEWLKKWTDDGLEIYELGFAKAKEMFVERFPDISLDDFVLPAVISPSGETVLPSEAGDAAASHPPGEEKANLDVGRRPRRNAVYFTDSSKLSISKVAALNRPRKHAKDSRGWGGDGVSDGRDRWICFFGEEQKGTGGDGVSDGRDSLYLKKQLYQLQMDDGSEIRDHLNAFSKITTELLNVEVKIDEEDLAIILLSSLPSTY
ncbi:hypothetical protein RJ639_002756 [Escallonia herrerae]|uniref:Uncharacterized protein n=1 Tax=Escallonia herrerae TaxID=1293975 RepID=A0AA88W064_9ASTE|nr:hypothetical protein RJ639_002756 [Escallonia herrerae]